MKRRTILTALLAAGILSISITTAQQQPGQRGAAPFGGTPSVDAITVSTWKVPENFKGSTQPPATSLRPNAEVVWEET